MQDNRRPEDESQESVNNKTIDDQAQKSARAWYRFDMFQTAEGCMRNKAPSAEASADPHDSSCATP